MTFPKKHTVIEILWLDSHAIDAVWEWKDDYNEDMPVIRTIGYFVRRKDGILYVAQSISKDQYGQMFKIPLGCVRSIRAL